MLMSKLVGYADYPNLGPTHKEINAKKLMSLFKNIKSYFPKTQKKQQNFFINPLNQINQVL